MPSLLPALKEIYIATCYHRLERTCYHRLERRFVVMLFPTNWTFLFSQCSLVCFRRRAQLPDWLHARNALEVAACGSFGWDSRPGQRGGPINERVTWRQLLRGMSQYEDTLESSVMTCLPAPVQSIKRRHDREATLARIFMVCGDDLFITAPAVFSSALFSSAVFLVVYLNVVSVTAVECHRCQMRSACHDCEVCCC